MSKLYRPNEIIKLLGIGRSTFWLYVKEGKLKAIKLSPKVTVVKEEELLRFINEGC